MPIKHAWQCSVKMINKPNNLIICICETLLYIECIVCYGQNAKRSDAGVKKFVGCFWNAGATQAMCDQHMNKMDPWHYWWLIYNWFITHFPPCSPLQADVHNEGDLRRDGGGCGCEVFLPAGLQTRGCLNPASARIFKKIMSVVKDTETWSLCFA